MAATHTSQIETAISRLPQTAYGTAHDFAADYRRILNDAQTVGDFNKTFENDANYDAGADLANDIWAVTNDTAIPLTPDFCFQDAPFLIHDILGGYSVGPVDALYQHIQTPQSMNSSRQLPSRTIMKKYGGLGLYLFRSMVATSLTISGGKSGRVKMAAQYKGDGYQAINPVSYTMPAIVADREWGYSGQIAPSIALYDSTGTAQVETATAVGAVTTAGTINVVITAPLLGPAVTIPVAVLLADSAATWAGKVRTALRANRIINTHYIVSGVTTAIVLTSRRKAANETLNIALNANGTGITDAPTSADTVLGVVGSSQVYSCDLETWSVTLNNPAADEGYRACSPYLTDGVPESGSLRSEYLCGQRDYMFEWTARLNTGDKALDWMNAGTNLAVDIPILGKDSSDFSTRITHDRARIIEAKPMTGAGGDFIGISGKATLMAVSGAIGLSIVTVNNVASYAS